MATASPAFPSPTARASTTSTSRPTCHPATPSTSRRAASNWPATRARSRTTRSSSNSRSKCVLEDPGGVHRGEVVRQVVGRLLRLDEPARRAHGEDLDEREAGAGQLRLESAQQHLLGAGHVAGGVDRTAGDERRPLELGQQIAQQDGVAVFGGVAALERVLGALADDGGGSEVTA